MIPHVDEFSVSVFLPSCVVVVVEVPVVAEVMVPVVFLPWRAELDKDNGCRRV